MPELVLGLVLRHAGLSDVTVWVETDAACEVEVLGCSSPTFRVGDHHYALVHVTGLESGTAREYEVRLDGTVVWPEPGSPFPRASSGRGKKAGRSSSSSARAASPRPTRRPTPWTSQKTPGASAWTPSTRPR